VTTIRRMSARQRTAFLVSLVLVLALVLAGLTAAAGRSSRRSPADHRAFRISGDATQPFVPGSKQSLDLTITNPDDVPLALTSLSVTVQDRTSIRNAAGARDGCSGTANMVVVRSFGGAVTVAANTSESLSAAGAADGQLPQVQMRNRRVNQDACKNATFHFTYAGTATRSGRDSRNGHNAR
jgi:hypothetical protein